MSSVSTLPSPTSFRVSYLEWYLPLLSCPNHTRVIPDFIPSHALHFQSISSSLDPIYKILLLYPFVSSHHHLSKRSHLTTAVSSPGLSLVRFHVFQNKGADCGNAQNTPSCSYSIPNLSMSCSVVQGLAFLSNSVSYHTSPKCSSYIPSFLQFKTHHKFLHRAFACTIPFYQNAIPPLFTQLLLCSANFYMAIKFQLSFPLLMDTFADSQSWDSGNSVRLCFFGLQNHCRW